MSSQLAEVQALNPSIDADQPPAASSAQLGSTQTPQERIEAAVRQNALERQARLDNMKHLQHIIETPRTIDNRCVMYRWDLYRYVRETLRMHDTTAFNWFIQRVGDYHTEANGDRMPPQNLVTKEFTFALLDAYSAFLEIQRLARF